MILSGSMNLQTLVPRSEHLEKIKTVRSVPIATGLSLALPRILLRAVLRIHSSPSHEIAETPRL